MSKLRRSARGKPCQVRIPGVCNFNPETTVLAHLNGGGMGRKQDDFLAAYACSACHDEIDRRTRTITSELAEWHHLHGMKRTLKIMFEEGLLTYG